MAFLGGGGDSWLSSYESAELLVKQIQENIIQCQRVEITSSAHAKSSSTIRRLLAQLGKELANLKDNLGRDARSLKLTEREVERRQRMLDNLSGKEENLTRTFYNRTSSADQRSALMSRDTRIHMEDSPVVGWGEESETTRHLSQDQLQARQRSAIQEQDEGLESLSQIIQKQKHMATSIGQEVDIQNELIDDITDHVDNTKERLIKETRHVRIIDRKTGSCWYWIVIILLFIAIILVATV